MTAEDLIFLIRHDRPKVNRLRTYLSWKDVRKNVKDSSDGAGGPGADDVAGIEDAAGHDGKGGAGDGTGGPGGKNANAPGANPLSKARRMRVKLSWELLNGFTDAMVGNEDDDDDDDDEDAYLDSMQRLRVSPLAKSKNFAVELISRKHSSMPNPSRLFFSSLIGCGSNYICDDKRRIRTLQ